MGERHGGGIRELPAETLPPTDIALFCKFCRATVCRANRPCDRCPGRSLTREIANEVANSDRMASPDSASPGTALPALPAYPASLRTSGAVGRRRHWLYGSANGRRPRQQALARWNSSGKFRMARDGVPTRKRSGCAARCFRVEQRRREWLDQ